MEFFESNHQLEFIASLIQLTQIREQTKKISLELNEKYPQVEWTSIKAFRNRIIHEYKGIKVENVFNIIKNNPPDLLVQTNNIISIELKLENFDINEFNIAQTSPYLQHVDFESII